MPPKTTGPCQTHSKGILVNKIRNLTKGSNKTNNSGKANINDNNGNYLNTTILGN